MHGQRRLAGGAPDALIGIGEQGCLDLGKTRAAVGTILVGELLDAEKIRVCRHGSHIPPGEYSVSICELENALNRFSSARSVAGPRRPSAARPRGGASAWRAATA